MKKRRVLECVPKFLNVDKQFKILSFYIPSAIENHSSAYSNKSINADELNDFYFQLTQNAFSKDYYLDWFVKKVFSDEEINGFQSVIKYTVLEKLNQSYKFVKEDLIAFSKILKRLDDAVDVEYRVSSMNIRINLNNFVSFKEQKELITIPPPNIVTRHDEWYRNILLDHSLESIANKKKAQFSQIFALRDIELITSYLNKRKSRDEYETCVEANGKGGKAIITIIKKNITLMKFNLFKLGIKCLIIYSVSAAIILFLFNADYGAFLFYGLLFGGWMIFISPIQKILEQQKEIKEYERKRKRFAEN
jgi:hypothetical protein